MSNIRPLLKEAPKLVLKGASEKQNMQAIRQLLLKHPNVLFAERRNGGAREDEHEDKQGNVKRSWTWFYEIVKCPVMSLVPQSGKHGSCLVSVHGMVAVDFEGWLTDNRPFAIEVKEGDWRHNKKLTPREAKQLARIDFIRERGGVAGFATSVDEAQKIIES